jgi:sugar transferase (PEP-CTERM/EpsH1 system associated)
MTRITHVLHSLAVGGTENGVVNLITALRGDFEHTVIAMTETGPLASRLPADVQIHQLGKRVGLEGRTFLRLVRLLRRLRPDVVHSRNWAAFDAVPAARVAGVPMIVHGEHGREAADPHGLNARRRRLRRVLGPLVDRFVTVSVDLGRWLIDVVGIPERKVITIHNGVDTERFSDQERERGRAALGVEDGVPVIGAVGRLDPVKDHAQLIDAFGMIARERPRALLAIVGEGPTRRELERRIAACGLDARVRLLGTRADVPLILKGFDVFVLPSIAEGMSNTILEAMATGLPIVATRVGGTPELIEDGTHGRLVPAGDSGALAEALAVYLDDPVLRALHGKASRQRAIGEFDLERMAAEYRALYSIRAAGCR